MLILEKESERDRSQPHRNQQQLNKPYMNQKVRNRKYEITNGKGEKTAQHILSERTILPLEQTNLKKGVSERSKQERSKFGSTVTTMIINQTSKLRLKNLEDRKLNVRNSQEESLEDMNYEEYD